MNRDFEVGNYFWLWIFGLAFGLTEAAVVVYLRQIFNDGSAILFPVKFSLLGTQSLIIGVEIQRELASVVLLAVFSIFFSPRFFFRFLGFTVLFGVWDLSYYLFLKLQLGWPPSLFTYDILFLFPTLWVAPVFCPMLVSATMIFFSSTVLFHAKRRVVRGPTLVHWSLVLTGGLAVLYSMMGNAAYFQNGGLPPRFGWDFFVGGYGLAVLAASHYLLTVMQSRTRF